MLSVCFKAFGLYFSRLFKALIYEILRISSVVFMGVAHTVNEDIWITLDDNSGERYKIPKNASIKTNVDYVHFDCEHEDWKAVDGDRICLENFLNHKQSAFEMNPSFIGFGVGRRDCVGKSLAMKELYFMIGHLLMHYRLSLETPIDNILQHRSPTMGTMFMHPAVAVKIQKL